MSDPSIDFIQLTTGCPLLSIGVDAALALIMETAMNAERSFLEALYRDHAQRLRVQAKKRVGPLEDEDVVHDVFLKLIQFKPAAAWLYPKAYLFRVTHNAAVDAVRRQATRVRYVAHELNAANILEAGSLVEPDMTRAQMESLLRELPPACRRAFLLHWFDEMSQAEVARHLGVSVRTVERRLAQALAHLRDRTSRGALACM